VTPTNPGQQRSAEAHSPSAPYASDDAFQGGAHGGAGWPGAEHDSGDAITGPLVSNVLCAMLGCSAANAVAPGEAGQDRVSNGQHAVEMAAALTFAKYLGAVAGAIGRGAGAEVGAAARGTGPAWRVNAMALGRRPQQPSSFSIPLSRRLDPEKMLLEASSIGSRPGSNLWSKRLRAVETAGVALSQAFFGGLDPVGTQPEAFFSGLDPVDHAIGFVFFRSRPQGSSRKGFVFGGRDPWGGCDVPLR
jgi:hypothetical protein